MGAKYVRWLLITLMFPLVCIADVINIKDSAPQVYVVKKGDTLWDISSIYLDKPWLWPELWRNNVHITNPHLIYPGDEIRLRYNEQGEPVLEVVREPAKPQIKLSPEGKKSYKQIEAIPALPWSVIQPYIENDMVMSEDEYNRLPHLLGNHDGAVRFSTGDLVLSRKARRQHDTYHVIRKQNEIRDQFDNLLGYQVRHVADASPMESDVKGQVLVNVEEANFEAMRGDKLLPAKQAEPDALKLMPATRQRGNIVSNLEQHGLLGKFDVVIVDLGSRDIEAGTVMGIYSQGPDIIDGDEPRYEHESNHLKSAFNDGNDVKQPALKVGELVVFKVFEKASYGLITRSSKVIRNGAIVGKP